MDDLISREAALRALEDTRLFVTGIRSGKTILAEYAKQCRSGLIDALRYVPAADAEYVRHGYWIELGKTDKGSRILKCSHCGVERKGVSKSAYCRDCGCKMDLLEITDATLDALIQLGLDPSEFKVDNTISE